jgi:hypothetical protein
LRLDGILTRRTFTRWHVEIHLRTGIHEHEARRAASSRRFGILRARRLADPAPGGSRLASRKDAARNRGSALCACHRGGGGAPPLSMRRPMAHRQALAWRGIGVGAQRH